MILAQLDGQHDARTLNVSDMPRHECGRSLYRANVQLCLVARKTCLEPVREIKIFLTIPDSKVSQKGYKYAFG